MFCSMHLIEAKSLKVSNWNSQKEEHLSFDRLSLAALAHVIHFITIIIAITII